MNYIYNSNTFLYKNLTDYLAGIASDTGDIYHVLFLNDLDAIFEGAKKRTAMRGRFALDQLDKIALTDDEKDWFDEVIKNGGSEIFRKISAYSKDINEAYKHDVPFGNPVYSGAITSVLSLVVSDSTKSMTVNELAGYKLVITSQGDQLNQERTILSNTANTITLDSGFTTDITGMEYAVFTQTSRYIIYFMSLDTGLKRITYSDGTTITKDTKTGWDVNMIQGIDASITEALIGYAIKEWYLINRMMEDYEIEASRYNNELVKIRNQINQGKKPARRVTDFFQ